LRDPVFIKWKPTVAYWLFAAVFLGSQFIGAKSLAERMMGHAIQTTRAVWRRLNLAWVVFFVVMGVVNLYVAYHYSEETWVNFKLFGLMGLTFVFVLAQGLILARFIEDGPDLEK
ncbi:MAG: septation protein IspZ, partial [Thiohalobacteraceae bacterium]